MVQRYEVRGKELGGDEFYTDWVEVVKYEDYAKLSKAVRACVVSIREGSLTLEHVQGYLEGVIGALENDTGE